MTWHTLRAQVALWTVAIVLGALILFAAGSAWILRRGLFARVDEEIQNDRRDFLEELRERKVDWHTRSSVQSLFAEEGGRFQTVEAKDATGRLLYRSPDLGPLDAIRAVSPEHGYSLTSPSGHFRFHTFAEGGITFALGKDLREVDETVAGLVSAYLLTLPLLAIAVGGGSLWIARRATGPVGAIAARAEKISASDLHQRIPALATGDEIAQLASVLNAMFERLQRSFEQVTRFTSDASHELKTPLALMRAQLEGALDAGEIAPAERELLSHLIAQCSEISQIVDALLFLSRADDRRLAIEQEPVDLVALVHELREDAEILAAEAGITLEFHLPATLIVDGDLRLLRRAVMNLIDNAIKHNRGGGCVIVSASTEGRSNILSLRNTGPGIPLAAREKIFERFYRSDPARERTVGGHGLGLSIAREIARAHRGEVTLVRSDSDWTEFWLLLSLAAGCPSFSGREPAPHATGLEQAVATARS